jgi:hypothetical protein
MDPRTTGYALIAAGVLFNNYVYLHDIVLDKHEGFVHVGLWSAAGILIGMGIVGFGARLLTRSS